MITLKWNETKGEGYIQIRDSFKKEHYVVQLDSITDWIYELKELNDKILLELRKN